jgi:hypothetical protein
MLAHGARCSIGDQLHPRGTLDQAAYDLIAKTYARVEEREPWLIDAESVTQIAVMQSMERPVGQGGRIRVVPAEEGAVRVLTHLKHQFDLIDRPASFDKYELLILPDTVQIDNDLAKKLRAYLKRGGALLMSGMSGLNADATACAFADLPIKPQGMSPFASTYLRFGKEIDEDVPATDHVMYERGARVTAAPGATTLARVVEPYFDRTWRHFSSHAQTATDKLTKYAVAVQKGKLAYISYPIFTAIAQHGNYPYRLLVRNIIERLMPQPLLRVDAPTTTEATITRQRKLGRTIVHLLQYAPERRTEKLDLIEDIVPLYDVPLSLKLSKAPKKVYLAPSMKEVAFEYLAGHVNLRVPEVHGHAMIVFE